MDNKSLLAKSESIYLKGILILLIILGHNSILMHLCDNGLWLKDWIYSFHVNSFFYLPFLYGAKAFKMSNIIKYFYRLMIPYTIFFVILLILHTIYIGYIDIVASLISFISGCNEALRNTTGFTYIWFLPSMFSILILRDFYYSYKRLRILIILVTSMILTSLVLYKLDLNSGVYFPIGLFMALANFPLAIFFRPLIILLEKKKKYSIIPIVIAIVATIIWFCFHPQKYIYNLFIYLILPISIFPTLIIIVKNLKFQNKGHKVILSLGNISMGLYLISQLVYNILLSVIGCLTIPSWIMGFLIFILTIVVSVVILKFFLKHTPLLYNYVLR